MRLPLQEESPIRFALPALFALAGVAMLSVAAAPARHALWGLHSLAYVPPLVTATLVVASLVAALWLLRARGIDVWMSGSAPRPTPRLLLALGAAGALTFWVLRVRHLLLGDGLPIVASAGAFRLHPLEPLGSIVQHAWVTAFAPMFRAAGHHDFYAAWHAIALGSALLGGGFVIAAGVVAREWGRASGAPSGRRTWLAFSLIVVQGYVLLFCGYVEHYGALQLAMTAYVWTALRHLNGRGGLAACGLAMTLAVAMHLSALMLLPSFIALAAGAGGRAAVRGVAAVVLAGVVLTPAFAWLAPGYSLPTAIWTAVAGLLVEREGRTFDPLALINVALLAGPAGIFMFGGFMRRARAATEAREHWWFATTLGVGPLVALLIAGPSNLGYARNWDLLAPTGLLFLVAGLVFVRLAEPVHRADRWLIAALIVSALHVVPWVALNTDEEASIRRMADLPLGGGRGETTIGYWRLLRGRPDEARSWFERAVAASPDNVRARLFLGELLMESGDLEGADPHLRAARTLRPDLALARVLLARATWLQGSRSAALAQIEDVASDPGLTPKIRAAADALSTTVASGATANVTDGRWRELIATLRGEGVR